MLKTFVLVALTLLGGCKFVEDRGASTTPDEQDQSGLTATRNIILSSTSDYQSMGPSAIQSGDVISCQPGVVINQSPGEHVFSIVGVENVTIRDCTIAGLGVVYNGPPLYSNGISETAIYIRNAKNIHIRNVVLRNISGQAGITVYDSEQTYIDRAQVLDFSFAGINILGSSKTVEVKNSRVEKSASQLNQFAQYRPLEYGYQISSNSNGRYPEHVTIMDSVCKNLIHWDCYDSHGGNYLRWLRNRAENSVKCYDAHLKKTQASQSIGNIVLIGNYCGGTSDARAGQRFPRMQSNQMVRDASGNIVYDYSEVAQGIFVGGAAYYPQGNSSLEVSFLRNVTISNNRVENVGNFGSLADKRSGIGAQYALNTQIVKNEVYNSRVNGISLVQLDGFSVYGNQLLSNSYAGIYLGLGNRFSTEAQVYRPGNVIATNKIANGSVYAPRVTQWGISVASGVSNIEGLQSGTNSICLGSLNQSYQSANFPQINSILSLGNCL